MQKGNEKTEEDAKAKSECLEAQKKYAASLQPCENARKQANKWQRVCDQPTPKGIHSVFLCGPAAVMTLRANSLCESSDGLAEVVESKCHSFEKAHERQVKQAKQTKKDTDK